MRIATSVMVVAWMLMGLAIVAGFEPSKIGPGMLGWIGLWLCRKRVIGKRYACDNPACRFKYESWHDGTKEARPTWGVTKGEV